MHELHTLHIGVADIGEMMRQKILYFLIIVTLVFIVADLVYGAGKSAPILILCGVACGLAAVIARRIDQIQ